MGTSMQHKESGARPTLGFTGHPLLDVGIATITAFAGKRDPAQVTIDDLEAIADYMAEHYVVNPLKSFLTVAFPNSGFTQPLFEKAPKKRAIYAERVLRAFRPGTPMLPDQRCVFTGQPAVAVALDVEGKLPPGRTFRQHIPLLTGEDVINFHPYGNAGLPVSGVALLALQAFPLGCAKVQGRLLAVHADDPDLTLRFARKFWERNRKLIYNARLAGESKIPEPLHRAGTLLIGTLLEIEKERREGQEDGGRPASITAYHISNSGQSPDLDIYYLPLEVGDFLRTVLTPRYHAAWDAIRQCGWEITAGGKRKTTETLEPRYNTLYEDALRLPDRAASFIRTYFLRIPARRVRAGDPRATYSIRGEAGLVSWTLTDLFLRRVMGMDKTRIEHIRALGDALADYVQAENDRRFFRTLVTAHRYEDVRVALIKAGQAQVRRERPPLVSFDQFVAVFEEGDELPYHDWRLARDLVLIRMIERLYTLGWIKAHVEELPEPELEAEAAE
jgi:CRISPR-associated protein Cst1